MIAVAVDAITQRCRALRRDGERCRSRAGENGLCPVHDPERSDEMRAVRSRGGSRPRRRKPQPQLDGRARAILAAALDDKDPGVRVLAAAAVLAHPNRVAR